MIQTSKKVRFNKLAQMAAEERQRALSSNPGLLSQLSPTEIALLFPDYFKRGKPDVGGFREAISRQTAERNSMWQQGVNDRLAQQGSWLERMRSQYGSGQYTDSSAGRGGKQFQALAPRIMKDLQRDFPGLSKEDAAAIVGNLGEESGGFGQMSENGGRGPGRGWAQWTSPDRRAKFLANVQKYGGDLANYQANYETLRDELKGNYAGALKDMMAAKGLDEKTNIFMRKFENPGVPAYEVRMRYAQRAMNVYEGGGDSTTPSQGTGATTPGSQAGGQTTGGMSFNVKSGYIVPKDDNLYDPRNAQQCATLGKAFNPSIGRSSGWNVVDGQIKAGQVVATKQYNNGGADRVGAGYHTGVAMTAPNEKGDFLLLEQYNNSGGAKLRWVNQHSYPAGSAGGTTSWGLISSNGKVHDEISQEALAYGHQLGTPEQRQTIGTNSGAPGAGGESAPGVSGEVSQGPMGGATFGQGDQQTASLLQPMGMVQNLMGMAQGGPMGMMGMMGMGGMGMQSATPLGLITTAMGFIMPLIGSLAGERLSGEGMGDGPRRKHHHGSGNRIHASPAIKPSRGVNPANAPSDPKQDYSKRIAIEKEANRLGINPHHLTTAMLYESIGSLNPDRMGVVDKRKGAKAAVAAGAQNRFMGLIQFGAAEQKKYGVKPGMSFDDHMHSVGKYLEDKGLTRWLQKNPNATEQEKRIALYSTINAGGPDKKHWHKTDKRYGGSSSTVIQKTEHMFRDWGGRASTLMAANDPNTQVAAAKSTGEVGQGVTTPGGASPATPQQVAASPTIVERLKQTFVSAPAAAKAGPVTTTPRLGAASDVTPSTSAVSPNSMNVGATPAPTGKFSREARNSVGVYSTPSTRDMMYQFAQGKKMSATVMPQAPAVAASTSTPTVAGTPAAMPAPGPAPDMASVQMGQMRNDIAAVAAQQQNTPVMAQQPSMAAPPSQGFNPDFAMKQIAQPYNTPSFQRAVTRAFGSETPGDVGQNHFSYGNAR